MVDGVPVRVLVGGAEARDPQRRGIGQGAGEIGRRGAGSNGGRERAHDVARMLAQKLLRQAGVVPPAPPLRRSFGQQRRQFRDRRPQQGNEVDGVAPGIAFLGTACLHQFPGDGRKHRCRMLPADQVERLERLVDEVEQVAAIGEAAFGRSDEHELGHLHGRSTGGDGGEQGALGAVAMAHENPVAKPSLQRRGCPPIAGQGLPRPRWNRSVAVARHPADSLEEGQAKVVVRQERKQVAERGQHGEAGAPAVAVPRREDDGVAHQAPRIDALADQSEHRFGDDEPDVVLHPLPQAVPPVGVTVGVARARGHPHLAVAHLDVGRGDVIGPRIECPAGDEVEAGVMPVAGENAVGDGPPMQRESQVRTAIVERVDPIVVADHQDRAALALDHHHPLRPQLVEAGDTHEPLVAVGRRGTIENLHSVESNMSGRSDNTPLR